MSGNYSGRPDTLNRCPRSAVERTSGLEREKDRGIPIEPIIGLGILDAAANITEQVIMLTQIVTNDAGRLGNNMSRHRHTNRKIEKRKSENNHACANRSSLAFQYPESGPGASARCERVAMHLLEACVVFAMALTFVIAFRLNK